MDRTDAIALRMMGRMFPELTPDVESASLSGLSREEAVVFLVHHNTVPTIRKAIASANVSRLGTVTDFTTGSVMDVLSGIAMDWLDLRPQERFSDYAAALLEKRLLDGAHLAWMSRCLSLDAANPSFSRHNGEAVTYADTITSLRQVDRSYLVSRARSLQGRPVYRDDLDAVVVDRKRKTTVVRDCSRLSDVGYSAEVRAREETAMERMSPIKSRKLEDRVVMPSEARRRRWKRTMRGFNPTCARYYHVRGPVYPSPHPYPPPYPSSHSFSGMDTGTVGFSVIGNKTFVRELPEHCSRCLMFPACSGHTVSRSLFFTRGVHLASVCGRPMAEAAGGTNGKAQE